MTGGLALPFAGGKTGETGLVDVVGKGEGKNNIKFELPVRPLRGCEVVARAPGRAFRKAVAASLSKC